MRQESEDGISWCRYGMTRDAVVHALCNRRDALGTRQHLAVNAFTAARAISCATQSSGKVVHQVCNHTMQPTRLFGQYYAFQAVPVDPVLPELKASGFSPCPARDSVLALVPGM